VHVHLRRPVTQAIDDEVAPTGWFATLVRGFIAIQSCQFYRQSDGMGYQKAMSWTGTSWFVERLRDAAHYCCKRWLPIAVYNSMASSSCLFSMYSPSVCAT